MRKVLVSIGFFALVLLGSAQAQYVFQGNSRPLSMRMVSGHKAVAGAAYQGPGDIIPSALAWWATSSCYTAAYSGHVMDIMDTATGTTTGSRIDCTSGTAAAITSSSACTWITGNACSTIAATCATACSIRTIYDQSGANDCGGSPCNLNYLGSLLADAPSLTVPAIGSKNCATNGSGQSVESSGTMAAQAQPFTVLMVAKRASGIADLFAVWRSGGTVGTLRAGYFPAANTAGTYSGNTFPQATASDTHYHTHADLFNSASSAICIDGSCTTGLNLGNSTGISGSDVTAWFWASASTTVTSACEIGVWAGDKSSSASAYNTNVVARYGVLP